MANHYPADFLVTGGAGFIGSHIVDELVASGAATTVVDDLSTGSRHWVDQRAHLVEADVAEASVVDAIREAAPRVVVHAAAQVSVASSVAHADRDRLVNLIGTENVIKGALAAGAERLVFVSSGGAIYGETAGASEDSLPQPASPYGIHKLAAEWYVRTSGLSYGVARLANVYGPRQRAGLEGGVVAVFAEKLANREPVTIFGSGEQSRDFVYVADVVDAILKIAGVSQSGTWNVSTDSATSITVILEELERIIGPATSVDFRDPRPGDVRTSRLENGLIRSQLGWTPKVSLIEGLSRIAAA